MPHQCLKCGQIFKEGSSQLLKGCPECNGNRFFFTKQPLDEKERDLINNEVKQDISSQIMDSLVEKDFLDKSGKWVNIKPKEIRKIIKDKITEDENISKSETVTYIDVSERKKIIDKIKSEINKSDSLQTIEIEKPGKYNIDLKGLLEEEPIIIQKDGSYTIHLPSVFKTINKKK